MKAFLASFLLATATLAPTTAPGAVDPKSIPQLTDHLYFIAHPQNVAVAVDLDKGIDAVGKDGKVVTVVALLTPPVGGIIGHSSRVEFLCGENKIHMLLDNTLAGTPDKIVIVKIIKDASPKDVVPNTVGEKLYNFICKVPPKKDPRVTWI